MITYRFGYDISSDLPHGLMLVWGEKRKRMLSFHWDWPRVVWFNRSWAVDEKGYIKGMPVWRKKPKTWLVRRIYFPLHFRWVRDCAKEKRPYFHAYHLADALKREHD